MIKDKWRQSEINPMTIAPPSPLCLTQLHHRACLHLHGDEAHDFLQRLVTNDVTHVNADHAIYALLLTPQGKFRADMLITPHPAGGLRLDVARQSAEAFVRILERHRLTAKAEIAVVHDTVVWTAWCRTMPVTRAIIEETENTACTWFADPRHPLLGVRGYAPEGFVPQAQALCDGLTWDTHRLALGIPDGARDLIVGSSTVAEGNLDLLHAVNWQKGCYIGQELTARMHWRGLAKRRLAVLERTDGTPWSHSPTPNGETPDSKTDDTPDTPLYDIHGTEVARLRSTAGSYALALIAVENRPTHITLADGCVVAVKG